MKSGTTRQRILDIAEKQFFRHGFYRVSMNNLVEELHTSKSTIYKYFQSKEDLVEAVLMDINRKINTSLEKIIDDNSMPFPDKMEKITQFTGDILSRVGEEFLNDLSRYTPLLWEEYQRLRRERLENLYGRLINNGVQDGILRSDIQSGFLLLVYTKLTEIAVQPELLSELSLSNTEAYSLLSKIFLEGTLTETGREIT